MQLRSAETYKGTFVVEVPAEDNKVFITGNQENLGIGKPNKVQLKKEFDLVRMITLELNSPTECKFTRGNWNKEVKMHN
jgi:hypothetical protein